MSVLKTLKSYSGKLAYSAVPPYSKRKVIVFESDDWGSVTISDNKTFDKIKGLGFPVDSDPYSKYDNIASIEDLDTLFDLLLSFKDVNGNPPVITANTNMGNPDFDKISENHYKEFYFEPLDVTLDKYSSGSNILEHWHKGIKEKVFMPQLHGREHLNVIPWLREMQNNTNLQEACKLNVSCIPVNNRIGNRRDFKAALDYQENAELEFQKDALVQSFKEFERIFGFSPLTFIAQCYTWGEEHEKALSELGVKYLQGIYGQKIPRGKGNPYTVKHNYFGRKNKYGQQYILRNAFFEPSLYTSREEEYRKCLKEIEFAFKFGKPAVISVHRLNFIGSRDINNRDENLRLLKLLISKVLERWPDVQFLSSDKIYE
ncbi:hypothetical protein E0W68_00605 [Flavobacterium salilacus subsp. salilacus]|uniref:hypothetical protein n=1 Tax=Flavobacterium TaxID=237 RepID=UPI0010754F24|nr:MULTISPECIES: hypothetical protein [Flavobacterium]KAF2519766.1 hypothetical protein E0W68_00605 [Flavobacterium salilacus subsp. salilacus]MBE1614339.1 hypothetical protein [Flavobacterium sp. SaA2.13]